MFNLRTFIMETITGMIEKEPEYRVRQYALAWLERGVLEQSDLAAIETHYAEMAVAAAETEAEANEE